MKEKTYELIEHTADIGIKVRGANLKELFINAARAMFEILAEAKTIDSKNQKKIEIDQHADNLEELFINWLNELLSLSAAKELIFSDFVMKKLDKNNLKSVVIGKDVFNYRVNTEIKAATYHQFRLEQTKSGWQAQVIFDV